MKVFRATILTYSIGHFPLNEIDYDSGDASAIDVITRKLAEKRFSDHKSLSTFSFFQFLFFSYTFSSHLHSGIVLWWNLELFDVFLIILDNYALVECLHYKLEQFLDLKKDFFRRLNPERNEFFFLDIFLDPLKTTAKQWCSNTFRVWQKYFKLSRAITKSLLL